VRDISTCATFLDARRARDQKVRCARQVGVQRILRKQHRTRTTFEIAPNGVATWSTSTSVRPPPARRDPGYRRNLCAMHADMFGCAAQSGAAHLSPACRTMYTHQCRRWRHAHPHSVAGHVYHPPLRRNSTTCAGDCRRRAAFARARSQIHALTTLGVPEVRVIAPRRCCRRCRDLACRSYDMRSLKVSSVMMLRLQNERMQGRCCLRRRIFQIHGLTQERLALRKRTPSDASGPMNRGVEIDSSVADGAHSVILHRSVRHRVRMALEHVGAKV